MITSRWCLLSLIVGTTMGAGVAQAQNDRTRSATAARLDSIGVSHLIAYEQIAPQVLIDPRPTQGGMIPIAGMERFDQATIRLADGDVLDRPRNKIAQKLREDARPVSDPPPGEATYRLAVDNLLDAVRADSASRRIRGHLFRAYTARGAWKELQTAANKALTFDDADANSWLARALALHRLEQYPEAAASFDSAMRRLPPAARASYELPTRLVPPKGYANKLAYPDSLTLVRLPVAERARLLRRFWGALDPRPATVLNEAMLEYFARIAYANLRWSTDAYAGIDTDRGDVHVRFGPPERVFGMRGQHVWIYRDNTIFFFGAFPGYLGSALANAERRLREDSLYIEKPVYWADSPLMRNSWPMRARVARFRAGGDSVDAVITAAVPVRSLLGGVEIGGEIPLEVFLAVSDSLGGSSGEENRRVTVNGERLPVGINGTWVRRLDRGTHVVRLQADQRDAGRTAIANEFVDADSSRGFGMSDILLGTEPTAASTPARWRDVRFAPTVGIFPWKDALGLVWETYDLAPQNGEVRYSVRIDIERTFAKSLAGFTAKISRGLVNLLTQDGSATGKVSVSFDQSRAASEVVTDYLSINLQGSVTGPYRVVVTVTDKVSGRVVSRRADFVLTED